MSKSSRVLLIIIGCIVLVVACQQQKPAPIKKELSGKILVSKFARPLTDIKFASSPERLERGKYLVNGVLACFSCHAQADTMDPGWAPLPDKLGSGRMWMKTDSTHIAYPNISPDRETGAGKWTDDMFVRALREGIGHDGRALVRMPWWNFRNLSDEDLASVIVYIHSIPAVHNSLPERLLTPAEEAGLQNEPRYMSDPPMPQPDSSTLVARGKYLVALGECEGCHTPWYKRNSGFFSGGNVIANDGTDSVKVSANISSGKSGIGTWDDETFIRVIRTGKGGTLHHTMPWASFKNMNDRDLKAVLAALKTTEPVEHRIVNGLKPTLCPVCGETHGYGDQNKIVLPKTNAIDSSLFISLAGKYCWETVDTAVVLVKDRKLCVIYRGSPEIELKEISKGKYYAEGLPYPIIFTKGKDGKAGSFYAADLQPTIYKRVD
ncbi:MAG: hypothetical protein C5B52_18735 [Bacteroidetes bacterium]|nr:MAG: hypothetical protein C5B52_18735 [Bacteroidota bacterium]